jgi:hypothetical protein
MIVRQSNDWIVARSTRWFASIAETSLRVKIL